MIKVGVTKLGEKNRKATYRDVVFDKWGWSDSSKYLPADFDLMYVKIEGEKSTFAWTTGIEWIGLRIKPGHKIIAWKRKMNED